MRLSTFAQPFATFALAASLGGCAVSTEPASGADATDVAALSAATESQTQVGGSSDFVVDMAKSLVSSIINKEVTNLLFPSSDVDYARMAQDYANAARQANVDQTVMEQAGLVQGKIDTLHDLDVRRKAGADPKEVYAQIDNNWTDINGMLGVLSQDATKKPGLAAYITGAQIKLNMIGELVVLSPEKAAYNKALLVDNATKYLAYARDVKPQVVADAIKARLDRIVCVDTSHWGPAVDPMYPPEWITEFQLRDPEVGTSSTYDSRSACGAAQARYVTTTRPAASAKVYADLAWQDTIMKSWADLVASPNTIQVTSATYGGNCGKAVGNVTPQLVAACDSLGVCDYAVSTSVLGDPAYGCAKTFEVDYTCRGVAGTRTAQIAAEADGKSVHLACK